MCFQFINSMQDSSLDISYAVNYRYLKSNSPATVFVLIEIYTNKTSANSSRKAILSIAIDCSSSMQGKKFKQAKEAALDLVELLGGNDYLSIISFDKSARVDLGSTKKSESTSVQRSAIKDLKLGKGTNIYDGLELAYKEVSKEIREEADINTNGYNSNNNTVKRTIVLLTDGQSSVGETEETEFVNLSKRIREQNITISTIGIGDNYDQQLLHAIAEAGSGIPYHVKELDDLQKIFSEQADELSSTMIINPDFTIRMMPGAHIQGAYMVTPTLIKQNIDKTNNSIFTARLRDIVVGERQTMALRIDLPERTPGIYRLARIESNELTKNIEIEYTDDHLSYSQETDPYPRLIFTCSEATYLIKEGVQTGDNETIRKAETLMNVLSQDKDFESEKTKSPMLKKMAVTVKKIIERFSKGQMTESERRQAIQDMTVILDKRRS